ncbi:MAG: glycosyltransferase family 4 protein, partial [Candidatus Phytoplasma sp.]|nr:glycosyltransferase family 4 protein [Phytoplasma sp.]
AKKERIKYIPNFVSEESFYQQDSENKNTTRGKYGIKPDEFVVLGVGQVQTRKGVMDFIEIASKMPHIKFVWAGGFTFGVISDGYKELKKAVETAPENVIFTDIIPRNQMNDMYNMADILFMPSYNELFPMAILESCSVGTPLLLRDLELYENILFDAYVKGSNNEEFISLIDELATKKEMYHQALVNANKIKTYYSRENIKKEWTNFYKEVHQEYVDNNYKRISKLKRK